MKSTDLQRTLTNYIVKNSRHEAHRAYIGLSGIADCEAIIYDRYFHGTPATINGHLKTSLSYDLEADLVSKLSLLKLYRPAPPIELYDGLVLGHPDGKIDDDDLIEIKTVERETWFPEVPHLPNKVFYQVQAYMYYGGYRRAHVIYLARDTGALRVIGVTQSTPIAQRIEDKLARLVEAVHLVQRPACSCGKCEDLHDKKN